MNIRNIVKEIEQADEASFEQQSDRRGMLKSFGAKVAMASLPLAVGSLLFSKKAAAKTTDTIFETLNFALTLSYFNYNFIRTANKTGGLIPNNTGTNQPWQNDLPGFESIEKNELAHIKFLNTAISALGGTPYTPKYYNASDLNPYYVPTAYDFTMGGAHPDIFADYASFLIMAQVFQDTIVRGIKGQIPVVLGNTTVLKQLLQIHSVEARHASFIRTVRRYSTNGTALEHPAPWITNDISPTPELLANYDGEDVQVQWGGVILTDLPNQWSETGTVPKISATAAFDEPLDVVFVYKFFQKFML